MSVGGSNHATQAANGQHRRRRRRRRARCSPGPHAPETLEQAADRGNLSDPSAETDGAPQATHGDVEKRTHDLRVQLRTGDSLSEELGRRLSE